MFDVPFMARPSMRRSVLAMAILALPAAGGTARAQPERDALVLPETVTLDDALKIFRQRGLELLIADAAVMSAEGDLKSAGAVPNPNWSLFGSYTFTYAVNATNNNSAYFNNAAFHKGLDHAASLSGKARAAAYAKLDQELMVKYAPVVPYVISTNRYFVSSRTKNWIYSSYFGSPYLNALAVG